MVTIRDRPLIKAVFVLVLIGLITAPAAAAITLTTSTNYDGVNGDSQAISTTITLSPDESKITDVVLNIDETSSSFIDFDSFQQTIKPGAADINVSYVRNGRFRISELQPNEKVTIEFKSYPRTVKSKQIKAANVQVSYVQNGQSLQRSKTITADMTSSSWFAYQEAKSTAPTPIWILGLAVIGGLALVGGAGFGAYSFVTESEDEEEDVELSRSRR